MLDKTDITFSHGSLHADMLRFTLMVGIIKLHASVELGGVTNLCTASSGRPLLRKHKPLVSDGRTSRLSGHVR